MRAGVDKSREFGRKSKRLRWPRDPLHGYLRRRREKLWRRYAVGGTD